MLEICGDAGRAFRVPESEKVERLVRDVISALSARKSEQKPARPSSLDQEIVNRLCDVEVLSDAARRAALLRDLQARGLSGGDIADHYIPAAARRMGHMWTEDRMSFVEVTIGTARLQSMLRELGPEWRADFVPHTEGLNALMIVPVGCYHTLGAMVAVGQLRRVGLSVRLTLGLDIPGTVALVQSRRFDMIMMSVSTGVCFDIVRGYVNSIRNALVPAVPVVVGGSVLSDHMDICRLTGADFATNDVAEAVALCGVGASGKVCLREAKSG